MFFHFLTPCNLNQTRRIYCQRELKPMDFVDFNNISRLIRTGPLTHNTTNSHQTSLHVNGVVKHPTKCKILMWTKWSRTPTPHEHL